MTDNELHRRLLDLPACTLPTARRPTRVAEFDAFLADSLIAADRPARTRLELRLRGDAEPLGRDLAARESACCAFFTFTFASGPDGPVMGIEVPVAHLDVLDALAQRADTVVAEARR
jgi:hypothetical protein